MKYINVSISYELRGRIRYRNLQTVMQYERCSDPLLKPETATCGWWVYVWRVASSQPNRSSRTGHACDGHVLFSAFYLLLCSSISLSGMSIIQVTVNGDVTPTMTICHLDIPGVRNVNDACK